MTSVQYMPSCSPHNIRNVMRRDIVARPSTPSFRIVNTPAVNPSPTFSEVFEEEEVLFEDVLSPKKLRQLSGVSDLTLVTSLDLVVDTTESSLGSLGNYLPNLRELRLSGSRICSVRDLGTTLRSLEVLWMSRCGLQDLDGIGSIGQLKELYLSYNDISDVSPLSMVDTLELVDMESNNVQTIEQVEFLCMCPCLTTLNIEGNPVTSTMKVEELRKKLSELLPNLKYLDDRPLKGKVRGLSTSSHPLLGNTGNLQSEIKVVNTSLKDTLSEVMRRPKSARSDRDDVSSPSPTPSPIVVGDHSSGLTQGSVICGPPSKLLNKLSRNVKENICDIIEKSAPPTPVVAWSEDPDVMLQEWQSSRDWLTRELTIDCANEEKTRSEKQANYEAALRETSRPSSRKLSRPSSGARRSPSQSSPRQSPSQPQSSPRQSPSQPHNSLRQSPSQPHNSLRQSPSQPHNSARQPSSHHHNSPRQSFSQPKNSSRQSFSQPKNSSRPSHRVTDGLYDESVDVEESPRATHVTNKRRSGSRDRSGKGKHRVHRQSSLSSSAELPKCDSVDTGSLTSTSLDSNPRAVHSTEVKTLPTPPTAANRTMSSRFRRLKVSIEDQVTQQSTVDVLFSDRMPRPGLNRHVMSVPKSRDYN